MSHHREIKGLRGQQQEDGRLFVHEGRLHLAYTAAPYERGWEWESWMELARLSDDGCAAEYHYLLPHGMNGAGREKNWQFFTDEGQLRFVYSLGYHVVMEVGSDRKWGDLDTPQWRFGKIGGGTPPVKIGDEWLSIHKAALLWPFRPPMRLPLSPGHQSPRLPYSNSHSK